MEPAIQCYIFVKYMLAGLQLQLSQMLPSEHTLTKYQALASTDVKEHISSLSQFPFWEKKAKMEDGTKQNMKVSLSRLFIQAFGAEVGLKSSNQDGNYFSGQSNRHEKVQAPPAPPKNKNKTKRQACIHTVQASLCFTEPAFLDEKLVGLPEDLSPCICSPKSNVPMTPQSQVNYGPSHARRRREGKQSSAWAPWAPGGRRAPRGEENPRRPP